MVIWTPKMPRIRSIDTQPIIDQSHIHLVLIRARLLFAFKNDTHMSHAGHTENPSSFVAKLHETKTFMHIPKPEDKE